MSRVGLRVFETPNKKNSVRPFSDLNIEQYTEVCRTQPFCRTELCLRMGLNHICLIILTYRSIIGVTK